MIILKVMGGLGNQLFQIAYARMLSLREKEDIYLDTSVYEKYKIRGYSLSNFIISSKVKDIKDADLSIIEKFYLKRSQKFYHVYQRLNRDIKKTDRLGNWTFLFFLKKGLYFNFDRYYYETPVINNRIKNIYGYFQSEKYFITYRDVIINELKVKVAPTIKERRALDEIKNINAIAVSMRLGDDYKKSKSLNVCSEDYYFKAMDYVANKVENYKFFIFSDDIERARRFRFRYPVEYIEGFSDYQSLRIMYECKHFVISNSSFSWWGAYLSEYDNKIIVAPSRWYNNSTETPDIYLDNMVLVDV